MIQDLWPYILVSQLNLIQIAFALETVAKVGQSMEAGYGFVVLSVDVVYRS